MSVAKLTLVGNLGADCELKALPSGTQVAEVSIGVSKKKDSPTDWYRVAIWNEKLFETATEYLKKGALVYFECDVSPKKVEGGGYHYNLSSNHFKIVRFAKRDEAPTQQTNLDEIPF